MVEGAYRHPSTSSARSGEARSRVLPNPEVAPSRISVNPQFFSKVFSRSGNRFAAMLRQMSSGFRGLPESEFQLRSYADKNVRATHLTHFACNRCHASR